jgi:hypothetical protein
LRENDDVVENKGGRNSFAVIVLVVGLDVISLVVSLDVVGHSGSRLSTVKAFR